MDATDRTIRNSVRNLRGLGLLSTRPMPGADGKRLIYRLAGVDADWQPAPKNAKESRPIIAAYRILAEGQVQSLEEAHRRIAYLESLLNERYGHPTATVTGGDGAQSNPKGPAPETVAADELPNRNEVPVHQPATEEAIAQTVRDNWPLLNRDKTWRKGINAAIRWYQEHPQELKAQLENLKLEQEQESAAQAAAKPAKAPVALETVTTPGTAEARTRWAATLDRLEQELPRATFETWLRPTEGHSLQGNDLKVLTASPHHAEWLEQRIYQTILRALRQGPTGRWMYASRWGRPIGRRRGPGSGRVPGLYQTPSTEQNRGIDRVR